jgi:hypothetical protein
LLGTAFGEGIDTTSQKTISGYGYYQYASSSLVLPQQARGHGKSFATNAFWGMLNIDLLLCEDEGICH